MSLSQLRALRYQLDSLFYYSFDNLTGEQRLTFRAQIDMIDQAIESYQEL